ncbi:hypothetical protein DY000_02015439 [Brassica cretica]|uniref:Uncharacterized protein n=1 Tax=Brassica cretica TaxID=69181 RepID=A0ABQ7CR07_BRACR|nr:hypothetical protein DY000_02015439 [Brassica cretica]
MAPEVDNVIEGTQRTPFMDCITSIPIPSIKLKIPPYNGKTDPTAHDLLLYRNGQTRFNDG